MRCSEYEILISAYADGELDASEKARVEAHIGQCGDCKRLYDETVYLQHKVTDALAECLDVPDLMQAINAQILPKPRLRLTWAWAAAMIVLFAVLTYSVRQPHHDAKPTQRVVVVQPKHKPISQHVAPKIAAANEPRKAVLHVRCALKPTLRRAAAIKHITVINHSAPAKADDAAEVVVEYTDIAPFAEHAADLSSQSAARVPIAGPGRQIIAETQTITENGRQIQRMCYRVIDAPNPDATIIKPIQGEPNAIY